MTLPRASELDFQSMAEIRERRRRLLDEGAVEAPGEL